MTERRMLVQFIDVLFDTLFLADQKRFDGALKRRAG